jgi:hypothetical protein
LSRTTERPDSTTSDPVIHASNCSHWARLRLTGVDNVAVSIDPMEITMRIRGRFGFSGLVSHVHIALSLSK